MADKKTETKAAHPNYAVLTEMVAGAKKPAEKPTDTKKAE